MSMRTARISWALLAAAAAAKSLQSCPTLCGPRDGSPRGSPVPGILQARTLEWGAISFSNIFMYTYTYISGEGDGTPLQYSCLENPMDGGAWWAAVHGVMKSPDTTDHLFFHFSLSCIGEGNGNPLQCSCLENPRDGGASWAAIYGVAESDMTEET